jgi:hypothetical protein
MVLAVLSWPLVAASMGVADLSGGQGSAVGLVSASGGAVLSSALIAGSIGGRIADRFPSAAGFCTFLLALNVAIAALPLLPALLGENVGVGCEDVFFTGVHGPCTTYIVRSSRPSSGVEADLLFPLAPLAEPLPTLILAVGVGIWTFGVARMPED